MSNELLRDSNGNIIDIQQENLVTLSNTDLIIVPTSTTTYALQSGKYYDFGIRSLESESPSALTLSLANISNYVPNYSFQVGAKESNITITLPTNLSFDTTATVSPESIILPAGKNYHFNIWNNLCSIKDFSIPQLADGNPYLYPGDYTDYNVSVKWTAVHGADRYQIRGQTGSVSSQYYETTITDTTITTFNLIDWYPAKENKIGTPTINSVTLSKSSSYWLFSVNYTVSGGSTMYANTTRWTFTNETTQKSCTVDSTSNTINVLTSKFNATAGDTISAVCQLIASTSTIKIYFKAESDTLVNSAETELAYKYPAVSSNSNLSNTYTFTYSV